MTEKSYESVGPSVADMQRANDAVYGSQDKTEDAVKPEAQVSSASGKPMVKQVRLSKKQFNMKAEQSNKEHHGGYKPSKDDVHAGSSRRLHSEELRER